MARLSLKERSQGTPLTLFSYFRLRVRSPGARYNSKVITSSKLTVNRLREELEKRGLDTIGLKPVLVSRLDEAIAEEEAAFKDGHKDGANGEKRKRSSDSPPDEKESMNYAKRLKVEDVSGMTAKELKEVLSQRHLSITGKKGELVERLTETLEAKSGASTVKNALKDDKDSKVVVLKKGRPAPD